MKYLLNGMKVILNLIDNSDSWCDGNNILNSLLSKMLS